jgi:hypothetical protein
MLILRAILFFTVCIMVSPVFLFFLKESPVICFLGIFSAGDVCYFLIFTEDYCQEKGIACSEDERWLETGKFIEGSSSKVVTKTRLFVIL